MGRAALGERWPVRSGIEIYQDGTKLMFRVSHGLLNNDGCPLLEWNAGSDLLASALARAVSNHISERIKAVRRQEYEAGWRGAKAKRPKRDYFYKTLAPWDSH